MKIITITAQQMSADALSTALPADGVIAVTVSETQSFSRTATSVASYRGVKVPQHFTPIFRIEVEVEDTAVDQVIEGIAFARTAGLFGDARVRLSDGSAVDVFASARSLAA
jgi:nitrogen regulatory protein PII